MNPGSRIQISKSKTFDLPDEIRNQLRPGDEYQVSVTNDEIVLKKINPTLSWGDLSERIDSLGIDPGQPTLEEISEMVKEVRQKRHLNHEDRSRR
jgi:hypothetical protein